MFLRLPMGEVQLEKNSRLQRVAVYLIAIKWSNNYLSGKVLKLIQREIRCMCHYSIISPQPFMCVCMVNVSVMPVMSSTIS